LHGGKVVNVPDVGEFAGPQDAKTVALVQLELGMPGPSLRYARRYR
jgi:hypothetical protein